MDEITLTLPREKPFHSVAHLVLGGLASRLDLTVEALGDLQIAFDSLLDRAPGETEVTIGIRLRGDAIETEIGPFRGAALRSGLDRDAGGPVGLRRILSTVVEGVEVTERDGSEWVTLTKTIDR